MHIRVFARILKNHTITNTSLMFLIGTMFSKGGGCKGIAEDT